MNALFVSVTDFLLRKIAISFTLAT